VNELLPLWLALALWVPLPLWLALALWVPLPLWLALALWVPLPLALALALWVPLPLALALVLLVPFGSVIAFTPLVDVPCRGGGVLRRVAAMVPVVVWETVAVLRARARELVAPAPPAGGAGSAATRRTRDGCFSATPNLLRVSNGSSYSGAALPSQRSL